MHKFEEYTLIVRMTRPEYHTEYPDRKFIAHLREIPVSSLHECGMSQVDVIMNLRLAFNALQSEMYDKGIILPYPRLAE
jgi:hypothetical protein